MKFDYPDDSLALHTDAYELSMMQTYWKQGMGNRRAVFEAFFRKMPFNNGYAVYVGLDHIIRYIKNLHFTASDIDYLKSTGQFDNDFLEYLRDFRFTGSLRSFEEGDFVFNHEPILQVDAPMIEAQLVETAILNILNYQIMIATKASRIRSVVGDQSVMEFGTRRAQELDASIWGTRAAYIGGFNATSNVRAGKLFGIPISGTHAHALVQAYMNDYDAFKAYAQTHHDCVFLVDTFDTLKSGVPNAIKVAKEFGDKINFQGVRIDSGDMAYLSKRVRTMLDEAGFPDAKIFSSNGLDEKTIQNLKMQGAKIDVWGIGTKLITAYDQPTLGAVYKLVAFENEYGEMVDTIKISNNVGKMSTPGKKQVWRINDRLDGKSEGDYITLADEDPRKLSQINMFNPQFPLQQKDVSDFTARPMLKDIWRDGEFVYTEPSLEEIRDHRIESLAALWDEYKRDLNPEVYPVDLSRRCYDNKMKLIHQVNEYVKGLDN
ncbi:MAG: nicotinate phosphoribosyltransferase [Limosilactobacillus oris]|jgi:nicotinate phosphoribosyltransferase|uniref:nicotinate phosphoribosyltransferase n=1 Tax=Limosilactobacillus oris TaxID=1632 RepID=UPI00242C5FDA|nr:nicotinate phosphoribosyltransferase [Limosilactobacillus oris]MCH3910302.1 nicotinate phosphoribosyltransferase [Limosilactobacillus oris]MCH3939428.1 nicotinate phosphoribosyltransferase [Limosilactobacillus oris]MCI1980768.1 nicotinate phosphoribosyltransferase [Limosilactobacillus oris]MCI2043162.1 nicotinate phosphoribosyltransferase [Limosilactobacillus oris]